MFNDWALVWGKRNVSLSLCACQVLLLIHLFCILRRPTWKRAVPGPQATECIFNVLKCALFFECNSTDVYVKWCGKRTTEQTEWPKKRVAPTRSCPIGAPAATLCSHTHTTLSSRFIRAWRDACWLFCWWNNISLRSCNLFKKVWTFFFFLVIFFSKRGAAVLSDLHV